MSYFSVLIIQSEYSKINKVNQMINIYPVNISMWAYMVDLRAEWWAPGGFVRVFHGGSILCFRECNVSHYIKA